jgi:hypothetical protein
MTKPTGYQMMQGVLLLSGVGTLLLSALLTGWTGPDILRSVALILCGANFSGIFYNWLVKESVLRDRRMRTELRALQDSLKEMCAVNKALIEDRVTIRLRQRDPVTIDHGEKPVVH